MKRKNKIKIEAKNQNKPIDKYIKDEIRKPLCLKRKKIKKEDIRYKLVKQSKEIKKILKFRKIILVDYENWDPKTEPDRWDKVAVHFAAYYKNKLIGCLRIIHGNEKNVLGEFLEEGELCPRNKYMLECSRLAIHPYHRMIEIADGLTNIAIRYGMQSNFKESFLICWKKSQRLYTPWGWKRSTGKFKIIPSLRDKVVIMSNTPKNVLNSHKGKKINIST